jgi:fibronectin-binding autotransporter adhesin
MSLPGTTLRHARRHALLAAAIAAAFPASAHATNWTDGSGSWSAPGNWSAGVPASGTATNITETDGVNRVINYDYTGGAVTIGVLTVNLAGGGGGTATTAISMSADNLTNAGEVIGGVVGGPGGGTGAFYQTGGVHTDTNALNLGFNAGDNGFYSLGGGTLADNDFELLGTNGTGTLVQSGGINSMNGSGELVLGDDAGSFGSYTLSGTGSLFVAGAEIIGNIGSGIFTQLGGNQTVSAANDLTLGDSGAATGTYVLSGGTLNASFQNVGLNGTGNFNQNGGLYTFTTGSKLLQLGANAGSTGIYTMTGGSLQGGAVTVGVTGSGIFNQSGGSSNIALLQLGGAANSVGTYILSGGSLICGGTEDTTNGAGAFVQSGGTNTITAGSGLLLGFGTGFGSYTLSGTGVLTSAAGEVIGTEGSAAFVQTGGTNNMPGAGAEMTLGAFAGGIGSYTLSGGTVNVGGGTLVGETSPGVLNISGTGVFNSMVVLAVAQSLNSIVNLSGGTISTPAVDLIGGPFNLNWTGGTLNITADTTFDSLDASSVTGGIFGSSLLLGNSMTLMITGNETLGGTGPFSLEIGAGGNHYVSSTLTVSPEGTLTQDPGGTLYAGTLTQAGGVINGVVQNQGNFIYQSGQFNGELINEGNVTLGPVFTAGGGIENDATLSLSAGENITLNGIGLDNLGTFALNGATLSGNGPINNDYGGVFTARGTINPELLNFGTLTINGVVHLNDVAVNFGVTQGGGTVFGPFANAVGGIVDANGTSPLVFNSFAGNSATMEVSAGSTLNITNAWGNSGLVTLQGNGALLGGAGIANTGTIQGAGTISAPIDNQTGVIRPVNGELDLASAGDTNDNGAQIQAQSGGTILFVQGLAANDGIIALSGGTFDNNNLPIVNDATGSIIGSGTFRSGGLTNNGLFNLSGTSNVFGPVINDAASVLQISGTGLDSFFGAVSNSGNVQIDAGAGAIFYGSYTGTGPVMNDGMISIQADSASANISGLGNLVVGSPTAKVKLQLTAGSGTSRQSGLTIYSGSALDISNNTLAINYGSPANDPIAAIVAYLKQGYAGGTWTGTAGIVSSAVGESSSPLLSVGYADGNTDSSTAAAANQVLVKFTLAGDALLVGTVNFNDLDVIGRRLNTSGNDWANGNFNYDPNGAVNFNDLDIVGQNLNKTIGSLGSSGDEPGGATLRLGESASVQNTTVVPEPCGMLLAAAMGGMLMRRRRGRASAGGGACRTV